MLLKTSPGLRIPAPFFRNEQPCRINEYPVSRTFVYRPHTAPNAVQDLSNIKRTRFLAIQMRSRAWSIDHCTATKSRPPRDRVIAVESGPTRYNCVLEDRSFDRLSGRTPADSTRTSLYRFLSQVGDEEWKRPTCIFDSCIWILYFLFIICII